MENSKFIKNLKHLDIKQLEEFEKFLNSPYFLKRKTLPVLFSKMKQCYPEFNKSKREIYSLAYPGKPYNDVLLRKYISEMNNMLLEYLAVSSFKEDKMTYRSKLIDRLIETKNYYEAEKAAGEALAELEKNPHRNEKYYYNKYIFESYSKTISNLQTNLNPDTDWKDAMDGFVNYSALTVLQFYYIILNDTRVRKEKSNIDLDILNRLVKVYEEKGITNNPMAYILNNLVRSYLEPQNESYYRNIKEALRSYKSLLDVNELSAIYTYLHNYCFVKVDSGDLEYLNERFEIVNDVLANGFHLKDGYMVPDMFISMVTNALMLKKFKWAEDFIRQYKEHLPPEDKKSNGYFAQSLYYMFRNNFDKALECLSRVKYRKYYDKFKIKALNLMIFYEAGYFEEAFSQADSFRHYISGYKTVTPYIKERTNNFIRQILQMIKFRLKQAKTPEINGFYNSTIMYRPWLVQKLNELSGQPKP